MSNAALSASQQSVTAILALMGVIVAWRPPKKATSQGYAFIAGFIALRAVGDRGNVPSGTALGHVFREAEAATGVDPKEYSASAERHGRTRSTRA